VLAPVLAPVGVAFPAGLAFTGAASVGLGLAALESAGAASAESARGTGWNQL
jgi:hypothetical protein